MLDVCLDFLRIDVGQAHLAETFANKESRSRDVMGRQACVRSSRRYWHEITAFVTDIMPVAVASTYPTYIADVVA